MRFNLFVLLIVIFIRPGFCQKQMDEPTHYKDDLSIDWKKSDPHLKLVAKNKLLTPIQIYFHSRKDSTELKSFLLLPKDSLDLMTYSGKLPDSIFTSKFNDSIRISYFWGHKSHIHPDLDYLYRLPFKRGKKYEVSQSFYGKASHFDEKSKYAIDFQLNVGEPVYAAREGVVIKVIDWFTKQGGKELLNSANRIVILHSDGTLGSYVHLDYKGSFVKEGQLVRRGQKIGVSGLTGYTNGPHLHFVVRKENDIAIPIYFKGYEGKILKKGKRYKVVE